MTDWVSHLTTWYNGIKRDLPWRKTKDPYGIWVSEIMLQQTQVDTVIPYYNRFMAAFPTVNDLASADEQAVLKLWEGLGYYSRARNLHKAAKRVVTEYNSKVPTTYEGLQELPGLGPYCAAAVASIAFESPIPVVDGNVLRVFCRFWGIHDDIRNTKVRNALFERLTPYIQESVPSEFNQGMMELGALLCRVQSPKCSLCPLQKECVAYKKNLLDVLPVKSKSKPVPHHTIAVGVIWKNNKFLIGKRKTTQMLGGLWELPGGKQNKDELLETTVKREIKEETGLSINVKSSYGAIMHAYTHFKITMHIFDCEYVSGSPTPNSTDELRWIHFDEIDTYPFPKANSKAFGLIKERINDTNVLF